MKAIFGLLVLLAIGSAVWWATTGLMPLGQVEYIKNMFQEGAASNTADSAAKLGKVLKSNFDDAQDVYQNGAEAKYD